ncbi:MAG: type II toxin-antitoxin system prevent-host-death family antitoxin [Terracidiphilus sp.]|jgi:prevent-host-death family protein
MRAINIHQAKTQLSRLVEEVAAGEPFVIAKAGKPMAQVVPISASKTKKRIGFMKGMYRVPDDIKTPFAAEIEEMFYGSK